MKLTSLLILVATITLVHYSLPAAATSGLASRDLNPVLQPIYLPRYRNPGIEDGWSVDHNLFITNTLQQQTRGNESLTIDVENYQYKLDISREFKLWSFQLSVPMIANRSGDLDGLIENWHEFFGLPEGKRPDFPRDRIQIEYSVDGVTRYLQTEGSEGLGDIAMQIGYSQPEQIGYFAGIELPTGSESDFTGNESVDVAFWITREWQLDELLSTYGLLGISFPGDDGPLGSLLEDQIWVIQLGLQYRVYSGVAALAQVDYHSESIKGSSLKAFGHSLQLQLGLSFDRLIENHRLDLFFSEDIQVGSAPDISFGLRLAQQF